MVPFFLFSKNERKTRAKRAQNKNRRKTGARLFFDFPPVFRLFSACFLKLKKRRAKEAQKNRIFSVFQKKTSYNETETFSKSYRQFSAPLQLRAKVAQK